MIQNIGDVNWMQITKANCINLGIMGKFSVGAVYNGKNSDKFKYTNTNTQIHKYRYTVPMRKFFP